MNQARFFSICVTVIVLGFGALGFYGLPLATFQGDLTRMSILPEKSFGWTRPQPAIDQKLLRQATWQEADVLVIGDSFSESRIWQSVLVREGLKVRTESWGNVGAICSDFMPWLRTQGFKGKHIVFEVVERELESLASASVRCSSMDYHADARTDAPRFPPPVSFDVRHGNYLAKLSVGIRALFNVVKAQYLTQAPGFSHWTVTQDVRLVRLEKGCALFSHTQCRDSLFLTWDKADDIGEGTLKEMEVINARMTGITPVWAVVPNKSTVYLYPDKKFWSKAEQRVNATNLLRMMQQAAQDPVVDLYPANNTHLSTEGHVMMGEEIYGSMQKLTPR